MLVRVRKWVRASERAPRGICQTWSALLSFGFQPPPSHYPLIPHHCESSHKTSTPTTQPVQSLLPTPCGKASSFPDPRRIQSHRRVLREIRVHLKDASLNIAEIHSSIVFDLYKRDHLIQTCSHTWTYHPSHADYERRGMWSSFSVCFGFTMYYSGADLLIDWYQSVNAQDTHHNGILFNHLEYVYLSFYSTFWKSYLW